MSYVLTCPNCGPREVTDFGFGGEVNPRPRSAPSQRELNAYNYFRENVAGVQREWWFHRSGCGGCGRLLEGVTAAKGVTNRSDEKE